MRYQSCGARVCKTEALVFDDVGLRDWARYVSKDPATKRRFQSKNLERPKEGQRDGRFTQKKILKYHSAGYYPMAEDIERHYPGYRLADGETIYNEINGGFYIALMFRKIRC